MVQAMVEADGRLVVMVQTANAELGDAAGEMAGEERAQRQQLEQGLQQHKKAVEEQVAALAKQGARVAAVAAALRKQQTVGAEQRQQLRSAHADLKAHSRRQQM